jgi:hypothetical protein
MKSIFGFFFLLLFITQNGNSQITSVKYRLAFDCIDSTYSFLLLINEGSAITSLQRAQFNASISIVVPTKSNFDLLESHMPLQNNADYKSTKPLSWVHSTSVKSPMAQPLNDFYNIAPVLSPTSFYNNLMVGDIVKLFSFKIFPIPDDIEQVRLFQNGIDPSSDEGMGGADFSQIFTIGSATNVYSSNVSLTKINTTSILEETNEFFTVYPNPSNEKIYITYDNQIRSLDLYNSNGILVKSSTSKQIDVEDLNSGIYFVRLNTFNGFFTKKIHIK